MATVLTAPGASVSGDANAPTEARVDHLIDAYRQPAFNLAYRLVRRPEDAADAVQDAFVLAMRAIQGRSAAPREPGRFGSWLLKIVANVALAQLRRRKAATSVSLDALGGDLVDAHVDQPLATVMRREQRGDVLQALLALPDGQRAALTLREYQDLTYDEIGELLDLDRAAVAALLYRARAGFRAAYEGVAASPKSVGCARLAPLISAMLDAELEPDAWQRVDQHVADCRRCRRELKQLRRGQRLHGIIPLLAPPASLPTASALGAAGAAGATGAVGVVGVIAKSQVLNGLIARAADLARPLANGSWIGIASALPGGAETGVSTVVERGIGKAASVAAVAGLVFALAAGSPADQQIAEPASQEAGIAADRAPRVASSESVTLRAPGSSHPQRSAVAQPPVPEADSSGISTLVARPSADGPAVLPALIAADVPSAGDVPSIVAAGEPPAVSAASGPSAAPSESAARAAGPAGGGTSSGASAVANSASNGSHGSNESNGSTAGSSGAGGSGEPSAGESAGGGAASDPSGSIDLPSIDLPSIDLGIAGVDLPAIDLPPVDLSTVAAGTVDLPPVDLPTVSLPVGNRSSIDLPAIDPPAVNLPPVELPLAEAPLDRVRGVAESALEAGERATTPLGSLGEQTESAVSGIVQDLERTPASNTTSQRAGSGHATSPSVEVGGSDPAGSGASASVAVSPGTAVSVQGETSGLTVHTGVDAGAGPAGGGSTGLVESAVNLDAGSSSVTASIDVGSGSSSVNESSNSSSVNVSASVDTGSNGSNGSTSVDASASASNVSVSASVDTGSNSSSSSNSISVSASVDTSSTSTSVSVDVGSASVSVSVGGGSGNGSSSGGGSGRTP